MEEEEADDITEQAQTADNDNQHGRRDLRGRKDASDGLEADGDAKRNEEDAVDQCAEDLGSLPSVRVCRG